MSWYREAKAGLGVILMLATLVAVGVQSCRSTRRFRQANLEVDRARQEQRQLIALRLGVEQAAASERGYLISGEESALDPYHVAISEIAEDLKNLKVAVSAEPNRARAVSELEFLAGNIEGGFEAAIEARKNVIASGRIHPVTPVTQATLDELRQRIDRMATYAARRRDRELIGAQTGFRDVVWSLVSLTGLASLLVILAYLVARRDVAKRSRAEQALIESEERFRQISTSLQDILWVASPQDPHGCYVSAAYEPITGRSIKSFTRIPDPSWISSTPWIGIARSARWPHKCAARLSRPTSIGSSAPTARLAGSDRIVSRFEPDRVVSKPWWASPKMSPIIAGPRRICAIARISCVW